jgi:hypothetical protein
VTGRGSRGLARRHLRGLELLLGLAVVGVVLALCMRTIPALAAKARLTAIFTALPTVRNDSIEDYAVTGEFASYVAAQHAAPIEVQTEPQVSFDITPVGAGLLAAGHVGKDGQPFALSFLPAVSPDGEAHMRWLCGMHGAPAGWRAASAPATFQLPHGVSYADCRDDHQEGA